MRNNIILIGYMGCGKSTVGRKLAEKMQLSFLDTDAWIEEREGITISKIFASKGEAYFRDLETDCLKILLNEKNSENETGDRSSDFDLKEKNGYVISVGGGLPVREENQRLLQQLGQVIYLKARPDTIYKRIKGDTTRPLLQTENPLQKIQEMIVAREEKYQAAAHRVLHVDGKRVSEIVEEIQSRENKC